MTESTQLQTADNNNAGVVKMEPPTLAPTSSNASNTAAAVTAAGVAAANSPPAALMEQLLSPHLHQQNLQQQLQLQQQQQQYALKWNDFQSSILSSFRHLRDEEDFVDVTLACDQRSFTAHKVVLSACSPYFRKLLKANPCDHPIVILRDIPSDDVENLLSFMYNGEVNVSHEHLTEFLKTAHLLQIRGLADVGGTGSYATPIPTLNTNKSTLSAALTNPNSNKLNFLGAAAAAAAAQASNSNAANANLSASFTTPAALAAVASSVAAAAAAAAGNLAANSSSSGGNNITNLNSNNSLNNSLSAALGNNSGNSSTPAIQELKASASASASPANHHWDLDNDNDSSSNNNNNNNSSSNNNRSSLSHLTPPPQKRIKSADLFRAQHGISPERLLLEREFPVAGQHPLTRERRNRDQSRDRTRDLEIRDSLLSQALEQNSNGQQSNQQKQQQQHGESLHAQSAGEDSNSSDTEPSDRGDNQHEGTMDSMNGSMDNQRAHSFPSAFLGLQGIPGLLPGPSGIAGNDFVSRRSLEMRVRATDPRPCPKCGKIYRSAHTLRTHLEDKHTVCPGYRCVLCGTVAKSRNSLHSHMSRQHRGISTKDLPVLPMPSPFDPELASRLLAKAGVKISPAELRARASPTGGGGASGGGGQKLDLSNASGGPNDEAEDSDDDPEDLTTGNINYGIGGGVGAGGDLSRYHESLLSNFGHARMRNDAVVAAAAALGQKDLSAAVANQLPPTSTAAGQSLLDTYLQFITENTFGIPGMSQEHAAAAALHAAKMAQLNAIGHHGLDKLAPGLLPPQFDLAKIAGAANFSAAAACPTSTAVSSSSGGLTIEPVLRQRDITACSTSPNENNGPNTLSTSSASTPVGGNSSNSGNSAGVAELINRRRDPSEPMDLGLDNNQSGSNNDGANSDADDNYSEDEGVHHT